MLSFKCKEFLVALGSGASLTLSFAPFHLGFLVYVSLISLILLCHYSVLAKKFNYGAIGFAWGIGFFGTHVSWVFVSIYKYGGTNLVLAGIITLMFIVFLALFPAINLIILQKFNLKPSKWNFSLGFAASWVLGEIFRGRFLTGFPWGFLGYTQLNYAFKYYASYVGVFGVSFIVALIAALSSKVLIDSVHIYNNYFKYDRTKNGYTIYIEFLGVSLLIFMLWALAYKLNDLDLAKRPDFAPSLIKANPNKYKLEKTQVKLREKARVAIIQSNLEPDDKFLNGSIEELIHKIKKIYLEPTLNLVHTLHMRAEQVDLIIWPENSLPVTRESPQVEIFLRELDNLGKMYNFGILLGMPLKVGQKGFSNFYNSVVGLGQANGSYNKINLVPFGDYVPLAKWLRGLIKFLDLPLSSFIPGSTEQAPILLIQPNATYKVLATVCYDLAYADKLRQRVVAGEPEVIIAVSEDGWFGHSLGPYQHFDLVRMRALETGRYILRATPRGISAVIDDRGNVVAQAPMFKQHTLFSSYKYCVRQTIWNKIGNIPIILFLSGCLGIAIIREKIWN